MIEPPPEYRLALAFAGRRTRGPAEICLGFDLMLGKSVARAQTPLLGRIRLAWWRDAIEGLSDGRTPADPLLAALGVLVRTHDVKNDVLIDLVNAWETLLDDSPLSEATVLTFAHARASALFRLISGVCGTSAAVECIDAGVIWALVDFARHCSDPSLVERVFVLARDRQARGVRFPPALRPVAILVEFAHVDVARGPQRQLPAGSPRRILQAWKFVLSGG